MKDAAWKRDRRAFNRSPASRAAVNLSFSFRRPSTDCYSTCWRRDGLGDEDDLPNRGNENTFGQTVAVHVFQEQLLPDLPTDSSTTRKADRLMLGGMLFRGSSRYSRPLTGDLLPCVAVSFSFIHNLSFTDLFEALRSHHRSVHIDGPTNRSLHQSLRTCLSRGQLFSFIIYFSWLTGRPLQSSRFHP